MNKKYSAWLCAKCSLSVVSSEGGTCTDCLTAAITLLELDSEREVAETTTALLQELYEKVKDMDDESAGDGDGRIDTWQSLRFESLLTRVKEHLA